jgi:hypothetical protein
VTITTDVVELTCAQGEVYNKNVQHHVIKLVSDLRPVGGFCGYSGFLHQYNSPPRYNGYIVESGVKHNKPSKPNYHHVRSRSSRFESLVKFKIDFLFLLFFVFVGALQARVVVGASILLFPIAVSMNSKAIIVKHLLSSKMTNLQLSNKNIL